MKKLALLFTLWLCVGFSALAAQPPTYPQVEFQTNMGSIIIELYPDRAPKTVENFLQYVGNNHYEGTIFHRVLDNFIIQGGGLTADLEAKPTLPPVEIESNNGLRNEVGAVAMARSLQPDSATSQFFIDLDDNKLLNYYRPEPSLMGYTVFGKVVRGMDIARKIGGVPTAKVGGLDDVPQEPIVIQRVVLLETPVIAEGPYKPLAPVAIASAKNKTTKTAATKTASTKTSTTKTKVKK
ncbi:MAG: peptidylprolyl isomerase [Methylobacillus sp.]|jgi:peptidyl-prolyl cis-trans isomerase A (cyclophilin A)|nr:peptidylprolyl isomerase [Methylobacillus sp.]